VRSLFQLAKFRSRAAILILALPMVLPTTGCMSLFTSKRKLPQPIAPENIQTATADELVAQINDRWAKFESLTATVDIKASHLKTQEGTATDYPSFRSNLLLRKPEDLRILGKAPVVQTIIFDLASDGTQFTLLIPPKSLVYRGLNANKGTSPNWYENLRPGPIFSAMVVRGVGSEELYSVISESVTEEDAANKRLYLHPEYEISFVRRKPDSQVLFPVRVLHIHREDLLPYEQDLYDEKGVLETQVIYGPYKDFDGFKYPSTITMKRPQEEYQLMMTVERVAYNPSLTDDQFQVKVPPEYAVRELK
jgi:Outer membrane lipoprotein-sorting protein